MRGIFQTFLNNLRHNRDSLDVLIRQVEGLITNLDQEDINHKDLREDEKNLRELLSSIEHIQNLRNSLFSSESFAVPRITSPAGFDNSSSFALDYENSTNTNNKKNSFESPNIDVAYSPNIFEIQGGLDESKNKNLNFKSPSKRTLNTVNEQPATKRSQKSSQASLKKKQTDNIFSAAIEIEFSGSSDSAKSDSESDDIDESTQDLSLSSTRLRKPGHVKKCFDTPQPNKAPKGVSVQEELSGNLDSFNVTPQIHRNDSTDLIACVIGDNPDNFPNWKLSTALDRANRTFLVFPKEKLLAKAEEELLLGFSKENIPDQYRFGARYFLNYCIRSWTVLDNTWTAPPKMMSENSRGIQSRYTHLCKWYCKGISEDELVSVEVLIYRILCCGLAGIALSKLKDAKKRDPLKGIEKKSVDFWTKALVSRPNFAQQFHLTLWAATAVYGVEFSPARVLAHQYTGPWPLIPFEPEEQPLAIKAYAIAGNIASQLRRHLFLSGAVTLLVKKK